VSKVPVRCRHCGNEWLAEAQTTVRCRRCGNETDADVARSSATATHLPHVPGPGEVTSNDYVSEGPIRWIELRAERSANSNSFYTQYIVPDPNAIPNCEIRSTRVRRFPRFWRVVDVRWTPPGSRIYKALNSDPFIKERIMETHDVSITGISGYWIILYYGSEYAEGDLWKCYETIARLLLSVGK